MELQVKEESKEQILKMTKWYHITRLKQVWIK